MSRIILPAESHEFTTRERLINTSLPLKTETYSPVPHRIVIETILEQLDKANMTIVTENYSLARDGKQARATFQFTGGDNEMTPSLTFQNSYDKSLPLAAALGMKVIVCSNGMVMGDMGAFKRKHTGNILNEFIESISINIAEAGRSFEEMRRQRERMKEIEITKRTCAELIGRLYIEEALVGSQQMSIIKREIENPSFQYGVDGTVWNAYNACTVALKEGNPSQYLQQHTDLHRFISKEYELVS